MSCSYSFTTPTGTFNIYNEKLSKCQAEQKCKKMGQILAPITNKRDARRLKKHFYKNYEVGPECPISSEHIDEYHIGLELTDTDEGGLEKVFSNGVKWNDKKHSKLYDDNRKKGHLLSEVKENCTIALYCPFFEDKQLLFRHMSKDCNPMRAKYICLEPADKASAKSLVQEDNSNMYGNMAVSNVTLFAAFMALCCAFFAVGYKRQNEKLKKECGELKNIVGNFHNKVSSSVSVETSSA